MVKVQNRTVKVCLHFATDGVHTVALYKLAELYQAWLYSIASKL
jgi:hypothetical protein